jgi:hypothetical protein
MPVKMIRFQAIVAFSSGSAFASGVAAREVEPQGLAVYHLRAFY